MPRHPLEQDDDGFPRESRMGWGFWLLAAIVGAALVALVAVILS